MKQEEQERVLCEKKEAEELQRQQEEERKHELQRQEEERLKKIQREKEEKEALEAHKEVKNFLLGDLIHISDDDDSEDNAEKEEDDKKIDETKVKKEASTEDNVTPKSPEKTKTPEKKEPTLIPPGSIKKENPDVFTKSPQQQENIVPKVHTKEDVENSDDFTKKVPSETGSLSGQCAEISGNKVVIQHRCKDSARDDVDADNALAEIGALICDPDVLFALRNLKSIGQSMQQSQTGSRTAHRQFQVPNPNRKTCLFQDDDTVRGMKQEEAENEKLFSSPPQSSKKFIGMKRHTSQSFMDAGSAKRKKTSSGTPVRGSMVGSPSSTPYRPEICIAQADYKAKNTAQCDTFLKRKKVTSANKAAVFQHIKDKELEIIEYDTQPLSFYRIMTQYIGGLGMIPEDVRHKQVKEKLFTFVMQNVHYTKVTIDLGDCNEIFTNDLPIIEAAQQNRIKIFNIHKNYLINLSW